MTEAVSQRQLAREYGVSRRLITFIVSRAARATGFLKVDQVTEDKVEKARRLNEVAVRRGQTLAETPFSSQAVNFPNNVSPSISLWENKS